MGNDWEFVMRVMKKQSTIHLLLSVLPALAMFDSVLEDMESKGWFSELGANSALKTLCMGRVTIDPNI